METAEIDDRSALRKEAIVVIAYFAMYMVYLFAVLESEVVHWLTLVIIPTLLLYHIATTIRRSTSPSAFLASVGFRRDNLTTGLWWAALLGLALSAGKLALSQRSSQIVEILQSGRVLYLFPIVFVLLLLTAGFTEEFFFRGIMQTRLTALTGSKWAAVLVTSVLFGLYHLPYAYFSPNWPSHGQWRSAIGFAFGQGIAGGAILGGVYIFSRSNLLACVLVHTLLNSLPAMTMIRFRLGS
ncbi:MAG: CPBP family intramembrane metalloprotease [Phycisphaerae bacterium]|jgi:membrane protease YdiL (CAAX protease family)